MHRFLALFILFSYCSFTGAAQILPKDSSILNYRIIGFKVPPDALATGYELEIAAGHFEQADLFEKNISQRVSAQTNKVIAEVPSFGAAYTWRMIYRRGKSKSKTGSSFRRRTIAQDYAYQRR